MQYLKQSLASWRTALRGELLYSEGDVDRWRQMETEGNNEQDEVYKWGEINRDEGRRGLIITARHTATLSLPRSVFVYETVPFYPSF